MIYLKKFLFGVLLFSSLQNTYASPTTSLYEIEPNDTPLEATPFSGEVLLTGLIKKGDQDAYMWKITEEDSLYSWNIELIGVPNALTRIDIMKVIFTPDGKEVEDYQKFFSFGTRTGNKPVYLRNIIFEKGEYLIALTSKSKEEVNDAKSYQIILKKNRKEYNKIKESSKKSAPQVTTYDYNDNDYYHYKFEALSGWFKFQIDKKNTQKLWTIRGINTVGYKTKVTLVDEAGTQLTQVKSNRFGKLKIVDLELDEGEYYLKYEGERKGLDYGIKVYSTGNQKIEANEVEPNNTYGDANAINYKKTIYATVDKDSEYDYFSFSLPKKFEDKVFDIKLESSSKDLRFHLIDNQQKRLQEKSVDSNYTMTHVRLSSERMYYLYISGGKKGEKYHFKFSNFRDYNSSFEVEPNDDIVNAYAIELEKSIEGYFDGDEYDCFDFNIELPNKVWSLTARGDTLYRMKLYKGKSTATLLDVSGNTNSEMTFKNLLLLPGNYRSCLEGQNGAYTFSLNETALSDLNISSLDDLEHEPNQNESQTNTLKFGQTIKGMIEHRSNEDYFHFTLKNYENIKLTVTSPKDGDARFIIKSDILRHYSHQGSDGTSMIVGRYPPGRYSIELWSDKPNYGLYALHLERLDFFGSIDNEPNDNYALANAVPHSFTLKGHSNYRDYDYYKLPNSMTKETNVTISGTNLKGNVTLYPNKKDSYIRLKWDKEHKTYTATLKTPATSYIRIESSGGEYEYNLSFTQYEPKILNELELSLEVNLENSEVSTFSEFGQKVKFSVELEGLNDDELKIVSHVSDSSWRLNFDKIISIKSKEKTVVPFELIIPENIGKTPVVTTLKFSNKNGNFKTVSFTIKAKDNAKPLNPYEYWGIDENVLGGLNVARLDLGAKRVIEHNETELGYVPKIGNKYHFLFDDMVYDESFYLYSNRKSADENVTIELAGDAPSEIMGVILNPYGRGNKKEQLKDFSISLSLDGNIYKHIYRGTLGLERKDQAFVFSKTHLAKYARLTLHNSYENNPKSSIVLGEWKVIATQESIKGLERFNIADPKLGGHIVKASKVLSSSWDSYILTQKDDIRSSQYLYPNDKALSWVVGFKNERIAKISDMKWIEPAKSKKKEYMKRVKVLISTQTPNGPWKEMAEWSKGENNESVYRFEKPTWVRYLKFVFPIEKKAYHSLPETLEIFETKPSSEYKSILGEWGENSHRSFYEYMQSRSEEKQEVIVGNESREKAYPFEMNKAVRGRVSVANSEEDWYKLIIPKDRNQIRVSLSGKDGVDVIYELYNSQGERIDPITEEIEPLVKRYIFDVTEGEYYLKVKQPPVSVVFAWDNSGSVSSYHAKIFDAVNNYTQTIQPKIDAVNLLCFNSGDKFLLSDFSDKPTQIQTIFNNFDRSCSDSDAERPLRVSSEKLKNRDGTKGVIIIGDAVGSRDMKLWKILDEIKPKVFSIRVLSQYRDNNMYEGIMQSWSRVNNGTYSVVSNGIELYQAINRASAILRRPVYYGLNVQARYEKPLGPGTLELMFDPKKRAPVKSNFAVELILDASGSMLKRIGGKRRIAIARDVLKKAVRDVIPPKTMVALRVFGHKKADSCQTDLEMKLQPLNPSKMARVIGNIKAKNLAKTPIADSLAKVASDLSAVKGKKVVILVTDGKETCDGDPAKVIESLKAQGIDIRVNIVGFAIDNKALKEEFKKWAKIGNGEYFDARDKKSLDDAVKRALQVPYKVYNKKEETVARGIVGSEPISLPAGVYTVIVESTQPMVYKGVIVKGETNNKVVLQYGGTN